MGGFNSVTTLETIVFADNASFDGTERGGALSADGQLWIGSTASPHVRKSTLTAGTGVDITNGNGSITIGLTGGKVAVETLTDDVGSVVTPLSNNIQLAGHVLTGTGSTKFSTVTAGTNLLNLNPMTTARWIVDPLGYNGTHTTIQSAINSAVSGETIFIMPGFYTENLTMKSGVNLCGYTCDSQSVGTNISNVIIFGKITVASGFVCSFSGLRLRTNGDFFLDCGAASLTILNACFLDCNNNTGINSSGAAIRLFDCTGNCGVNATLFSSTGNALLYLYNVTITSTGATTVASTYAGGSLFINNSYLACPVTTSGNSTAILNNVTFILQASAICLTVGGTSGGNLDQCYFASGSASALSIGSGATVNLTSATVVSSNTNAITGAGILNYTPINFAGTSSTINTTTQALLVHGPRIGNGPGTQALPAYTFAADTSTGMWLGSAKLRFSAGGNLAFDVDTGINNFSIFAGNTFIQKITMQSGLVSNTKIPGAYPYTTLASDYVILVDTSSARTINLIAAPATGATYRIKDNTGSAATNNITISGNGKNIQGSGSFTMNVNYQAIDLIYNGTEWGVY